VHPGIRVVMTLAAAGGTALLTALGLTIVDLYLTGHVLPSIGKAFLDIPRLGIHLSVSDIVMFVATFGAGSLAWRVTGTPSADRR
jgi:hypothetical protein